MKDRLCHTCYEYLPVSEFRVFESSGRISETCKKCLRKNRNKLDKKEEWLAKARSGTGRIFG